MLKKFILTSAVMLLAAAAFPLPAASFIPNSHYAGKLDRRAVPIPARVYRHSNEMRGIWVATIFNIDYTRPRNTAEFKQFYSNMCRFLAANNFNAIFFQVRPANDAFYPSRLNPWSQFLSGREGAPLPGERNFDPLRFMIDEAHRHGLQFHAWLNPYRVIGATTLSKQKYLNTLAPGNFARKNPHLVMESPLPGKQRRLVLNPGEPQVRNFVTATVMEIVRNYNVDSIHFDDYFYPDDAPASADRNTYLRNNPNRLPLADWRRNNVTMLIRQIHANITAYNRQYQRNVRFGISPFGVWRNRSNSPAGSLTAAKESYNSHYADTRLWVKQRLIDYIVPQIYWPFSHETAAYAALVDWWSSTVRGTGVELYIGQAAYQLGSANWSVNELYYQMLYNRSKLDVKGSIIFSYRSIAAPTNQPMLQGGRNMLKKFWNNR